MEDSSLRAWRYRLRRDDPTAAGEEAEERTADAGAPGIEARAAYVETVIQQAIRRGDFDNLRGAGRPLEGLDRGHDPDWWIRRKIESERITGLGPPAILLRTEDAELDDRLDRLHREGEVREALEDFNRRIVDARRQLLGGPPVVTPLRDVPSELAAWRARREERQRAVSERVETERMRWAAMTPRERRAARRAGSGRRSEGRGRPHPLRLPLNRARRRCGPARAAPRRARRS
ncbi:DUF1992 domain-containing protein [Arenivirga flava]|uniref:DnaJ homologue subfamily C member 28 conserved domain-containing protein n=1 Tax=Arenivirga flava TaxID=1930060 RepID=A0AA37XBW9_9MICO|nr:hypothetical protein GCM10025874_24860 [Arenivirga flava]